MKPIWLVACALIVSSVAWSSPVAGEDKQPEREQALIRMRELQRERKWQEFVDQFGAVDFATWIVDSADKAVEAFHMRGQVYSILKNGKSAETDLKAALNLTPRNGLIWLTLADNYANVLNDPSQALATYRHIFTLTGKSNGWLSIQVTISTARILTDQVKPDEAIEVLNRYGEMEGMAPVWQVKMLRAYGHAYAAQGNEQQAKDRFAKALAIEQIGK
jgi:predicted Zn-dependent protease